MCKPIKILHVFGRLGRGGAPMRTLDVLRHVDSSRYRLHFSTLSDVVSDFDEEIRAFGGEVYRLPFGRFGFSRHFRELLRREQFDVVHSHVYHVSGFILRLAAKWGTPIRVAHFRNSYNGRSLGLKQHIQRRLLCRWIDRYATHILAVSEGAMRGAWRPKWRADPRCEVIYNGLEPAKFVGAADREGVKREFGLPADCLVCIHVGRIAEQKNHPRLLSIFAELVRHRPEARLLMVGWDVQGREGGVRKRIDQLGIRGRVIVCGERTDVPRLLKAADVLIFPSLWEGLPGVVLEACAAGTPVVTSDLPPMQEIAQRLPCVRLLSLEDPDAEWVGAVQEMAGRLRSADARRDAHQSFAAGVFTIDRCAEAMCRVWQGAGSKAATGGVSDG